MRTIIEVKVFVFLTMLLFAIAPAKADVVVIDGVHISSAWNVNIQPDYTAYLFEAIDSQWSELITEKIGQIMSYSWSRNIYDTEETVTELSQILKPLSKASRDAGKPFVIIAHSWGTVLSYMALSRDDEIIVDNFITLGSPLNAQLPVVKETVDSYLDSLEALPNIKQWCNYWADCDPISGAIPIANENIVISPSIFDDNGFTCHGSYFRDYAEWQSILLYVYLSKLQNNDYYILSGTFTYADDSPANGYIYAYNTLDNSLYNNVSVYNGTYEMALFPGDYRVYPYFYFYNNNSNYQTRVSNTYETVSVQSDKVLNFQSTPYTFYHIYGQVKDNNGDNVSGARLETPNSNCRGI